MSMHCPTQHLKISNKEKIIGYQEKDPDAFIIKLVIINTKVIIYKRRPERGEFRVKEVLRFTYIEMLNDEYECELHQKTYIFEYRWRKCMASLPSKFE